METFATELKINSFSAAVAGKGNAAFGFGTIRKKPQFGRDAAAIAVEHRLIARNSRERLLHGWMDALPCLVKLCGSSGRWVSRQIKGNQHIAIMRQTRAIIFKCRIAGSALSAIVGRVDGRAARALIWIAVGLFLIGFAAWATRSGLEIRDQAWMYSRSIRYHRDITNALHWGNEVLQAARQEIDPNAAVDPARSTPNFWQIVRGEGRVYDELVNGSGGDYQLDYPPLRLFTMALWTRHVQETFPNLSDWPGAWHQGARPSEEIAQPLLNMNTLLGWLSSIFAFFLVWLWVWRGGRRGTLSRRSLLGPRRPSWRMPTPLNASAGLLLFPILACLFFFAMSVAVSPCPEPPPMVSFAGAPTISTAGGAATANIRATINSQGAQTEWAVEWGTAPGDYSHSVKGDEIGDSGTTTDVSVALANLPANSTVHYRIMARNDGADRDLGRGITRTDDGILFTGQADGAQPQPPDQTFGAVWLRLWQWLGIAGLFAALSGSIRLMPAEHRGWACGLLAAMLMWLNPAILVDAHVWPQWDVWVLPPFLLTALLASVEWWFTAGLIFGIGTMFKGQFLIGAPVLLLWPLLSMRWGALTRLLLGITFSTALMLGPWLALGNQPFSWSVLAVKWIVRVSVASLIASLLPLLRVPLSRVIGSLWGPRADISLLKLSLLCGGAALALIVMIALILGGWPSDSQIPRRVGLWLFLGVAISPWLIRRRWLGVFAAGVIGVSIWMSSLVYQGNWSWETVGFEYGTTKFDKIAMARGSNGNLASILSQHFGWELHDQAITLNLPNLSGFLPSRWLAACGLDGNPLPLEMRQLLIVIFACLLLAAAAGAAINDRRNNPRFLAALVAPWMLMPNILGQMMCRYQLWGAALSALLVGISSGFTIVNVLFSALAAGMIGNQLLSDLPGRSPQLNQLMSTLAPDDGWIMLCMAVLVLFVAVVPGRFVDEVAVISTVDPVQAGSAKDDTTGSSKRSSAREDGESIDTVEEEMNFVLPEEPTSASKISV